MSNTAIDDDRRENLHGFELITPGGTEGYRTAEVTLGGVDTRSS
jgi:predicted flavoprotein YhiN